MIAAGLAILAAGAALAGLFCWHAATRRSSQFFGPSIYQGPGARWSIALTFDDGPGSRTLELARYLEEEGVHATFFVCGVNVQRHPDVIRTLALHGHELGNHTRTHPRLCPRLGWRLNLLSPASVAEQVSSAQATITEASGVSPCLVRAPYGLRWWGLRRAQQQHGLLHVLWTVIGHDWEWDAERVATHVLRHASPGGIVCLHDGRDTRPNPDISATLAAVRLIVPELKRQGYRFETVSQLLRTDAQAAQAAGSSRASSSSAKSEAVSAS